jgi:hypothetical protein
MISRSSIIFICVAAVLLAACEKNIESSFAHRLYADSVLFLKTGTTDHIVYPVKSKKGKYSSFPFGLELDENTGAINVTKSESGLRYLVFFDGADGCSDSTSIVISGINYPDHYYNLAKGDSIAYPVYNAVPNSGVPGGGSLFNINNDAAEYDIQLHNQNGAINLAATVRSGLFGATPVNHTRIDVPIAYWLNDESNKAFNNITVRLYYFTSMKEVPEYLSQLLIEREAAFEPLITSARFTKKVKPRPPCVIIIAH